MGLVKELQTNAYKSDLSVTDLVREAYFLSRKLGVIDIVDWLKKESDGYSGLDLSIIPAYRHSMGQIKVLNPYYGYVPIQFESDNIEQAVSRVVVVEPIGTVEEFFKRQQAQDARFIMPFSAEQENQLRTAIGFNLEITRFLNSSAPKIILDAVRDTILRWSLDLEEAGVHGQGLSFTDAEKRYASTLHIANYGTIQGVIGNSHGPVNVMNNYTAAQLNDLKEILKTLKEELSSDYSIEEPKKQEILDQVTYLDTVLAHHTPSDNDLLKEGLRTLRNLTEGIASGVVTSVLLRLTSFLQ